PRVRDECLYYSEAIEVDENQNEEYRRAERQRRSLDEPVMKDAPVPSLNDGEHEDTKESEVDVVLAHAIEHGAGVLVVLVDAADLVTVSVQKLADIGLGRPHDARNRLDRFEHEGLSAFERSPLRVLLDKHRRHRRDAEKAAERSFDALLSPPSDWHVGHH